MENEAREGRLDDADWRGSRDRGHSLWEAISGPVQGKGPHKRVTASGMGASAESQVVSQ